MYYKVFLLFSKHTWILVIKLAKNIFTFIISAFQFCSVKTRCLSGFSIDKSSSSLRAILSFKFCLRVEFTLIPFTGPLQYLLGILGGGGFTLLLVTSCPCSASPFLPSPMFCLTFYRGKVSSSSPPTWRHLIWAPRVPPTPAWGTTGWEEHAGAAAGHWHPPSQTHGLAFLCMKSSCLVQHGNLPDLSLLTVPCVLPVPSPFSVASLSLSFSPSPIAVDFHDRMWAPSPCCSPLGPCLSTASSFSLNVVQVHWPLRNTFLFFPSCLQAFTNFTENVVNRSWNCPMWTLRSLCSVSGNSVLM